MRKGGSKKSGKSHGARGGRAYMARLEAQRAKVGARRPTATSFYVTRPAVGGWRGLPLLSRTASHTAAVWLSGSPPLPLRKVANDEAVEMQYAVDQVAEHAKAAQQRRKVRSCVIDGV